MAAIPWTAGEGSTAKPPGQKKKKSQPLCKFSWGCRGGLTSSCCNSKLLTHNYTVSVQFGTSIANVICMYLSKEARNESKHLQFISDAFVTLHDFQSFRSLYSSCCKTFCLVIGNPGVVVDWTRHVWSATGSLHTGSFMRSAGESVWSLSQLHPSTSSSLFSLAVAYTHLRPCFVSTSYHLKQNTFVVLWPSLYVIMSCWRP